MPGPGGPGSAEDRALAARIDDRLLEQQVLVVAFPNAVPEVYVVAADQDRRCIVFCEAGVTSGGAVDLGSERKVPLTDIGSVRVDEGMLTVLGHDHEMIVQMHFEDVEPHLVWAQGLRMVIGSNNADQASSGPEEQGSDANGELHMLQARSQQMQNKIAGLETVNERRDKQLNKMVKRLDGAMQMLEAVEGMCSQQRKVICAQASAIEGLQHDLGLDVDEAAEKGTQASPQAAGNGRASPQAHGTRAEASPKASATGGRPEADSDASPGSAEPGGEEMEKMMALLQQAEHMKEMLAMLEAQGANMGADVGSPANESSPTGPSELASQLAALMAGVGGLGGQIPTQQQDEDDDDDEDDEEEYEDDDDEPAVANGDDSEAAALERLQNLEAEKHRFEGMLQDSQQEHQDLLGKLDSMRALMSAMGMQEGDFDDLDDVTN